MNAFSSSRRVFNLKTAFFRTNTFEGISTCTLNPQTSAPQKGKRQNVNEWHRWFAWFAVDVASHERRWMTFVWRIASNASYDGEGGMIWRYLDINEDWRILEGLEKMKSEQEGRDAYDIGHPCYCSSSSTSFINVACWCGLIFTTIHTVMYFAYIH